MRYEPVGYIYEIEIGAVAVYLIIMLRYFSARRFPNQRNRLYAMILWATVADVVLDIASSLVIDNIFQVPLTVTCFINTSFYSVTVLMLILMMIYAIVARRISCYTVSTERNSRPWFHAIFILNERCR